MNKQQEIEISEIVRKTIEDEEDCFTFYGKCKVMLRGLYDIQEILNKKDNKK